MSFKSFWYHPWKGEDSWEWGEVFWNKISIPGGESGLEKSQSSGFARLCETFQHNFSNNYGHNFSNNYGRKYYSAIFHILLSKHIYKHLNFVWKSPPLGGEYPLQGGCVENVHRSPALATWTKITHGGWSGFWKGNYFHHDPVNNVNEISRSLPFCFKIIYGTE